MQLCYSFYLKPQYTIILIIFNILDIVIIRDYIIGGTALSDNIECEADINFDSYVNLLDIILIINSIF